MNRPKSEVARAVCASIARVDAPPMEYLLRVRDEVLAEVPLGAAKYAILHTSGWFVLWVEGRSEIVEQALSRAASELGNEKQVVLHRSNGPGRLRDRIVVATTQTPLRASEFARWVMQLRDDGPALEPVDIWNRLGAPCLIEAAQRLGGRPAQQFALIAADDHGPVDQLRHLSERFASPIIYQRFGLAHLHSPDMGMAYVDIPARGGAARIRVMSGRSMARSTVRDSMPTLDAIVLLIGRRPTALVELASNIGKAVSRLEHPPVVWLAGASGEMMRACMQLLEQHGVSAQPVPDTVTSAEILALLGSVGLSSGP